MSYYSDYDDYLKSTGRDPYAKQTEDIRICEYDDKNDCKLMNEVTCPTVWENLNPLI